MVVRVMSVSGWEFRGDPGSREWNRESGAVGDDIAQPWGRNMALLVSHKKDAVECRLDVESSRRARVLGYEK